MRLAPALLALTLASPAHAGGYDIFGVTPRDIGMGGAMTASVIGFSALYYNPAALTLDRADSLGLNLALSVPLLEVDREDPTATPATVLPETHANATFGWVKPIGGIFEDRLAFGVSLSLPVERLLRVQGIDPAAPQFYLYQNLQDKLLIHLGAAGDLLPWLSLGAGLQILADLNGQADLELDILAGSFDRRSMGVTLAPTFAPFAGVLIHTPPADGGQLKLGLAFRGSSRLAFDLPVLVSEGEALDLDISVSQTVLWTPHQFALGLAYTLDDPAFTLSLDLAYALWSEAPDPSPRLSVDFDGQLLTAFGLEDALDLSVKNQPLALGFSDTLTARIGAEWSPNGALTLRGGYFFRPTPAPPQTGSTAYLDNDAHVLSLGLGFAFQNPVRARNAIVELDWSLQATILPRRTVYRSAPDHPGGDLSHAGHLWHTSLGVIHRF
jgi:long-chain fatty acid transport protein